MGGAEALIDTALAPDPASASALAVLEGQVLLIESTLPPITIAVEPTSSGVKLHDHWDGEASVSVQGTLIAMAGVALNAKESVSFSGDGNRIAIGEPGNDDGGSGSGQVRVFEWNGTNWSVGPELNDERAQLGGSFGSASAAVACGGIVNYANVNTIEKFNSPAQTTQTIDQ